MTATVVVVGVDIVEEIVAAGRVDDSLNVTVLEGPGSSLSAVESQAPTIRTIEHMARRTSLISQALAVTPIVDPYQSPTRATRHLRRRP
jgi:hypothetical protein